METQDISIQDINIQDIVRHFGVDNQLRQAQEECAELIVAISHFTRDCNKQENLLALCEEIADVKFMIEQMECIVTKQYNYDHIQRELGRDNVIAKILQDKKSRLKMAMRVKECEKEYEEYGEGAQEKGALGKQALGKEELCHN